MRRAKKPVKKEVVFEPSTYSVVQAAQILGISSKALYDALAAGTSPIKAIRIGRRVLIPKAALEAVLSQAASAA